MGDEESIPIGNTSEKSAASTKVPAVQSAGEATQTPPPAGDPQKTKLGAGAKTAHSPLARREPRAGDSLAHYKLTQKLGEGGMGTVFKAYEEALKRDVAVKVLPPRFAADPEFAERFQREAQAIARINHPNIIQVHYIGQQEEILFFAMELVDGNSLEKLLQHCDRLDEREALEYIRQAALGLQDANEHGVLHRDIKPANLMLTKKGIVKVADFGLSKKISTSPELSAALTATQTVMGTPFYMSPEQARARELDFRADIYSLGATLYHLLAGQPPFTGETAVDIMVGVISNPPPPIRKVNAAVSPATARLLDKILAKNPNDRQQSYAELIADIDAILAGKISSAPDWRRRSMMAGAAALLATFAGLLWSNYFNNQEAPLVSSQGTVAPPIVPEEDPDAAAKWEKSIDLLSLIDVRKDKITGTWKKEVDGLASDETTYAALKIPFQPPEEYDFRIQFTRQSGSDYVKQTMSRGGRSFGWIMAAQNDVFGFANIDNLWAHENKTTKHQPIVFQNGKRYSSVVQVRNRGLKAFVNGSLIAGWPTTYSDMSLGTDLDKLYNKALGIETNESSTVFHRVELVEISGEGKFHRPNDPAAKTAAAQRVAPVFPKGEPDYPGRVASAINLLPLIDVERDKLAGDWHIEGGVLVSEKNGLAQLAIPYRPPEEYDFLADFTREAGNEMVAQICSKSNRPFLLAMGVSQNTISGLEIFDGKTISASPTKRLFGPQIGIRHSTVVQVRDDGVKAFLDGKLFTEWRGDYTTASLLDFYHKGYAGRLGIASWEGRIRFHRLAAVEISGQGTFTHPGDAAVQETVVLSAENLRWQKAIDLLALTNPLADKVKGRWEQNDEGIVCDVTPFANLQFPYRPPEEYDVRAEFTRQTGKSGVVLILTKDNHDFTWVMGGWGNTVSGFENISGKGIHDNTTRTDIGLDNGRRSVVLVQVRKSSLKAFMNGKPIAEHNGNYSTMAIHPPWKLNDPSLLGIGADQGKTVFHRVQVLEITGHGKFIRPNDPAAKAAEAKRAVAVNAWLPLDISKACNADVISTADHDAADSSEGNIGHFATTGYLKKVGNTKPGLPDDGRIPIPGASPSSIFQLTMPPQKNSIVITTSEGRQPDPIKINLLPHQRRKCSQLAFLTSSAWGGCKARVTFHYESGPDSIEKLITADWRADTRTEPVTNYIALATKTTIDNGRFPVETYSQALPTDPQRTLEAISIVFDSFFQTKDDAYTRRDFIAGILAISAMPMEAVADVEDEFRWKNAVNLLETINPQRDKRDGEWQMENKMLVGQFTDQARLEIPYTPPDEYDIRIVFRRRSGNDTVGLILAKGDRQFAWMMGSLKNTIFGFDSVRGAYVLENATTRRVARCFDNSLHSSVVQVRRDGVAAYLDGKPITQWKTDYSDMSLFEGWVLRNKRSPGLTLYNSTVEFHRVEVLEVTGKGSFVRPDDPAPK